MCFHTAYEMEEYMKRWRADPNNHKGFVIMRDAVTNAFEEAYHCDATDRQEIANTIRNLRAWHPGDHVVDLSSVNALRAQLGMTNLSEKKLPAPTGEAPASEDENASVKVEQPLVSYTDVMVYSYSRQMRYSDLRASTEYIKQALFGRRAAYHIITDEVSDFIVEYNGTRTGRVSSAEDWRKREQHRYEQNMKRWFDRHLTAATNVLLEPIMIDGPIWTPELAVPKRIFAKTDNWLDKFMREHKYREDELALVA